MLFEKEKPSSGIGMVSESGGIRPDQEEMACDNRPFCDDSKLQMSTIFCIYEGPPEYRDRFIPSQLELPSSLCLSSVQPYQKGSEQGSTVSFSRDDSNRSLLASEGVVPGLAGSSFGTSSSVANEERSTQTAPLSQVPSRSVFASTSCLETVRRFSRHGGFSRKVSDQLILARRPSTRKIYQCKWAIYRKWCKDHGFSISKPTLPKVADFLLFLFKEKNLSISAIKGYRSMLSFVFKSRLPEIAHSYIIRDLLRSFGLERPPHREKKIGWDLNKVLSSLRSPPFEPIESIPLRLLTQKTLFLISLATAKRVSEIQALAYAVSSQGSDIILSYVPEFIAKTETTDNPLPRCFPLKSLGDFVGNLEEELLVCPVRCLRTYIRRTSKIPNRPKRLFLSPRFLSKALSKNAMSFFLRDLISKSGALGSNEGPSPKAHSIRSMATSLAFARNLAISSILEAATWKTNSVFASFYLKEFSFESGDIRSLGPCVAAGQVA